MNQPLHAAPTECDVCEIENVPLTQAIEPFTVCADCAEAWDEMQIEEAAQLDHKDCP